MCHIANPTAIIYKVLVLSWGAEEGSRGAIAPPKFEGKNLLWVCSPKVLAKTMRKEKCYDILHKFLLNFLKLFFDFQNFLKNFKFFH